MATATGTPDQGTVRTTSPPRGPRPATTPSARPPARPRPHRSPPGSAVRHGVRRSLRPPQPLGQLGDHHPGPAERRLEVFGLDRIVQRSVAPQQVVVGTYLVVAQLKEATDKVSHIGIAICSSGHAASPRRCEQLTTAAMTRRASMSVIVEGSPAATRSARWRAMNSAMDSEHRDRQPRGRRRQRFRADARSSPARATCRRA